MPVQSTPTTLALAALLTAGSAHAAFNDIFGENGSDRLHVTNMTISGGRMSLNIPFENNPICTSPTDTSTAGCHSFAVGSRGAAGFAAGTISNDAGSTVRPDAANRGTDNLVWHQFFGGGGLNRVNADLFSGALGTFSARDWDNGFQGSVFAGADGVLSIGDEVRLNLGGWYMTWNGVNSFQGTDTDGDFGSFTFVDDTDQEVLVENVQGTSYFAGGTVTGVLAPNALGEQRVDVLVRWKHFNVGGALDGFTQYWELAGTLNLAPVPEASTYGMMLAGVGLVGVALARRRKHAVIPAA